MVGRGEEMKTVAIVGKAELNWRLAPFDDLTKDIWGLGWWAALGKYSRITAAFEVHKPWVWEKQPGYGEWLYQNHDFPIYMRHGDFEMPACIPYPELQIKDWFFGRLYRGPDLIEQFFTSSIAYMLALALYMDYKRIEVYGLEMNLQKYQYQRDSIFWWLGYANGMRVQVVIPENSKLFINNHYGDQEKPA
jgi:hypothetical protein